MKFFGGIDKELALVVLILLACVFIIVGGIFIYIDMYCYWEAKEDKANWETANAKVDVLNIRLKKHGHKNKGFFYYHVFGKEHVIFFQPLYSF